MSNIPKMAFIGLSRAGKTTIYKRCFEHQSIDQLKDILPTIMISQNKVNLEHVSKGISIWDFGGQESFRKAYFQKPDYFKYTKVLIFIIDMLAIDELDTATNYFSDILGVLDENERPNIYVFIHKCDPEKINENRVPISKIILKITELFGETVEFFLTSVYDDSACRAINRILFLSLPEEVIEQIFSNLFIKDMKKAIFQKLGNNSLTSQQISDLSEISEVFGDLLTEKLYDLWIESTTKNIEKRDENETEKIVQSIVKDGKERFQITCQLEKCTETDCALMKGIIKGILKSLDITNRDVELIKDSELCHIIF